MFRKLAFAGLLALGSLSSIDAEAGALSAGFTLATVSAAPGLAAPAVKTDWYPHRHCRWQRVRTAGGWRRRRICH